MVSVSLVLHFIDSSENTLLLTVPSYSTIITYKGTTKGDVDNTNVNLAHLMMLVDFLKQHQERRVSIEIDEMTFKSLLLWIHSGKS
jgi:hypothetical protein